MEDKLLSLDLTAACEYEKKSMTSIRECLNHEERRDADRTSLLLSTASKGQWGTGDETCENVEKWIYWMDEAKKTSINETRYVIFGFIR